MLSGTYEQDASIVQCVNTLIFNAIACRASDIHIEPEENQVRIRYRIDGVLYDRESIPKHLAAQLISRVKILARCDIAEKRLPQDGNMIIQLSDSNIDVRVSTFPSLCGEKIVIRILDRSHRALALAELGLSDTLYDVCKQLFSKQQGLVLVTGPTGCGKTTTLYAALSLLTNPQINIITLEDPVEYTIGGITQGHINPEVGFTFARGMRAMLRQDPDVIMIGEIRDKETARVAIEAALTGHLILSTLHTNNAPSAIVRLMDMSIEPFLLNASLTGVIAQRLARMLCKSCVYQDRATDQERQTLEELQLQAEFVARSAGCSACFQTGYQGRIGIFEVLTISNDLRALIVQNPIFEDIYAQALDDGMLTLLDDAKMKLKQGVISLAEVLRVVC